MSSVFQKFACGFGRHIFYYENSFSVHFHWSVSCSDRFSFWGHINSYQRTGRKTAIEMGFVDCWNAKTMLFLDYEKFRIFKACAWICACLCVICYVPVRGTCVLDIKNFVKFEICGYDLVELQVLAIFCKVWRKPRTCASNGLCVVRCAWQNFSMVIFGLWRSDLVGV